MRTNWLAEQFEIVDDEYYIYTSDEAYVYELLFIKMVLKGMDTND